jgi:hypothetical protein
VPCTADRCCCYGCASCPPRALMSVWSHASSPPPPHLPTHPLPPSPHTHQCLSLPCVLPHVRAPGGHQDRCIPQVFLKQNPCRKTYTVIILSFLAASVSLVLILKGSILQLSGIYALSFLSVLVRGRQSYALDFGNRGWGGGVLVVHRCAPHTTVAVLGTSGLQLHARNAISFLCE